MDERRIAKVEERLDELQRGYREAIDRARRALEELHEAFGALVADQEDDDDA